ELYFFSACGVSLVSRAVRRLERGVPLDVRRGALPGRSCGSPCARPGVHPAPPPDGLPFFRSCGPFSRSFSRFFAPSCPLSSLVSPLSHPLPASPQRLPVRALPPPRVYPAPQPGCTQRATWLHARVLPTPASLRPPASTARPA